ncbi:MAG: transketolase [Lachnospirales bacterium]
MPLNTLNIDKSNEAINTLRFLSADAIEKANSGHPGLPLGMAPAAFTLFGNQMKHNPKNPNWLNRDRFVLSAGHGSALLYSVLHMFNYGLTMEDLKNFRQYNSKTPGHPEYGHTVGVEVTTGPLGQGIANAVGMALAESHLGKVFNKEDLTLVDHYTYAICGDGCLQEGVSSEASSLAGTLELGKLILLYDSNNISIEGNTDIAFRENVIDRYKAYGWQTLVVEDVNDLVSLNNAIDEAKKDTVHPTLILCKTKIGYGAPTKQGTAKAHGEPLGKEEIAQAKKNLNFNYEDDFSFPQSTKDYVSELLSSFEKEEEKWNDLCSKYKEKYPLDYANWEQWHNTELPVDLLNSEDFWSYEGDIATRVSSYNVLNKIAKLIPNLIGGSADLSPSTKTIMEGFSSLTTEDKSGRNLHFGIREFAMTAMANGIALHGGLRPYISGFFVFSDYMKPAMRLAALMNLPVINILTHDSIGVGEDGPTHQPVEQLAMLRSIPNFTVLRPCDTHETAAAWYLALTRKSPSALVLSRQNLPLLKDTGKCALKGGYILRDSNGTPDVILIATGSEVSLCYDSAIELEKQGKKVRVVSMLSIEVFEEQSSEYKENVLPKEITKRVVVEAASSFGWHKYTGFEGKLITVDAFGASAPANEIFKERGFTIDNVIATVNSLF